MSSSCVQAIEVLQWLVAAEGVPAHVRGIPLRMPTDSGCAPAIVHRALETALRDGYAQRRLLEESLDAQARAPAEHPPSTRPVPAQHPPSTRPAPAEYPREACLRLMLADGTLLEEPLTAPLPSHSQPSPTPPPSHSQRAADDPASESARPPPGYQPTPRPPDYPAGRHAGRIDDLGDAFGEHSECVVCLAAPREVVLVECGHACVCESCAATLALCPLCRAHIDRAIKVFQ